MAEIWTHPDWDSKLILENPKTMDGDYDPSIAAGYLGDDSDPQLLQREIVMRPRIRFDTLREFDG